MIQMKSWQIESIHHCQFKSIIANLNEPIVITIDEKSASSRAIHGVCKNIESFKCSEHTWVQIKKIFVLFQIDTQWYSKCVNLKTRAEKEQWILIDDRESKLFGRQFKTSPHSSHFSCSYESPYISVLIRIVIRNHFQFGIHVAKDN